MQAPHLPQLHRIRSAPRLLLYLRGSPVGCLNVSSSRVSRSWNLLALPDLSPEGTILFVSESVFDILGYRPAEVQGKSCFDFFHPHEIPFARSVHSRGILLDKAAVLHYCRIRARNGAWMSCECCFTVVHDVLVACTSIYRKGARSVSMYISPPGSRTREQS